MCIRDRYITRVRASVKRREDGAAREVMNKAALERSTMSQSGWWQIPVSYTHLDVYKRQDEKWVRCILKQLIANAVKYRMEQPVLRISTHKRQDQVCLLYTSDVYKRQAVARPKINGFYDVSPFTYVPEEWRD